MWTRTTPTWLVMTFILQSLTWWTALHICTLSTATLCSPKRFRSWATHRSLTIFRTLIKFMLMMTYSKFLNHWTPQNVQLNHAQSINTTKELWQENGVASTVPIQIEGTLLTSLTTISSTLRRLLPWRLRIGLTKIPEVFKCYGLSNLPGVKPFTPSKPV